MDKKEDERMQQLARLVLPYMTEEYPAFSIETDEIVMMAASCSKDIGGDILGELQEFFEMLYLDESEEDVDPNPPFYAHFIEWEDQGIEMYMAGVRKSNRRAVLDSQELIQFMEDYQGAHTPLHYGYAGFPPSLSILGPSPELPVGCPFRDADASPQGTN